jgi:hypothetical protein
VTEQTPPKIEFPCDYPLRIIGEGSADFQGMVVAVVRVHAPDLDESTVSVRESRNGNYHAITLTIRATGEPQLSAIFEDLKATGRVQMVL